MTKSIWLLGAALAAMGSAAKAETATAVEEVVVTARLEETLPQDLAKYGADLSVIDSATLRNNVYIDISQALQMQTPGVFVSPRNGPFSYVDIAIQGSRTGDVLWLVDGVRINNRLYTGTSPADTLPASMVERIEVLKGGQSLFYGTQAVAGAINVVTRGFSEEFEGQLTVGGHTNGGVHADAYVRDTVGKVRYIGWASKDEASGYKTFNVFQPSATDRKRGYDVVSFGGKVATELAENLSLNAYVQHTDAHLEYPAPTRTYLAFNDRDEEIASASVEWTPRDDIQLSLKGYFHDWDSVYSTVENTPGDPSAAPAVVDDLLYWGYQDYGLAALAKLSLVRGYEAQLGYDFQNFKGRDEVLLIERQTEQVHAVVAQLRTTDDLFETAHFAAGVRYNKSGETSKAIWNVSGRWDATPSLYVEGSAGTAFILPSAEQLFAVDPFSAVGNPNLKAEESTNLNASIGGEVARFTWRLTGFTRKVDDLIVDDYGQAGFPDGIYINTDGQVRFRGVEGYATAKLTDSLMARGSFSLTRARAEGAGRQFDRVPKAQAKGGVDYAPGEGRWGASASAMWTGDVYQNVNSFGVTNYGNYVVLDLAAHAFLDVHRRHKVTARLENALDEAYATRINSAAPDIAGPRFLYRFRGVPRTLHVTYAFTF